MVWRAEPHLVNQAGGVGGGGGCGGGGGILLESVLIAHLAASFLRSCSFPHLHVVLVMTVESGFMYMFNGPLSRTLIFVKL